MDIRIVEFNRVTGYSTSVQNLTTKDPIESLCNFIRARGYEDQKDGKHHDKSFILQKPPNKEDRAEQNEHASKIGPRIAIATNSKLVWTVIETPEPTN